MHRWCTWVVGSLSASSLAFALLGFGLVLELLQAWHGDLDGRNDGGDGLLLWDAPDEFPLPRCHVSPTGQQLDSLHAKIACQPLPPGMAFECFSHGCHNVPLPLNPPPSLPDFLPGFDIDGKKQTSLQNLELQ